MASMDKVEGKAQEIEEHPATAWLAAAGHVANGVVHVLIGLIAIGVATGGGGSADQSGALESIRSSPVGAVALWVAAIGLFALALHSVAAGIASLRDDAKEGVKSLGKAVAYGAVGGTALTYALGGSSDGEQSTESLSETLMSTWWGSTLLVLVGLAALGIGVGLCVGGIKQSFMKDVDLTGKARRAFVAFGTAGYLAKGVAVGVIGILFVVAVFRHNPEDAGGMDGALKALTALPFGVVLLILIGVGLITYGLFSFARAKTMAKRA